MTSKIVISDFGSGFENDVPAFKLNNDAFPKLKNFYVWRSRVLRKRGTSFLGRLQRNLTAQSLGNTDGGGAFSGNIVTILSLQANSTIVSESISITVGTVGAQTFTDNGSGVLSNGGAGTGTINYSTGAITLQTDPVLAATEVTIAFGYYPNLPVMGCEDFIPNNSLSSTTPINYPEPLIFDTTYSYEYNSSTEIFFDVSFYKESGNRLIWSGQDYQQFFSCSYYNATWVTNAKPGFHFATIVGVIANQVSANITLTLSNATLINGDWLWFNELEGTTVSINNQTGEITDASAAPTYVVTFSSSQTINTHTNNTGIAQMLTHSVSGQDGIRWYDGDPTPMGSTVGWVNFAPPLSNVTNPEYLVGAVAILPFKDRLLVFGPTTRTAASATLNYQNDLVIYSQNGTPFYTTLVPPRIDSPTDSSAWYDNVGGKGGNISAGINQPILTVGNNEDVLIIGFPNRQTRFVYTGNDFLPFLFYSINSERGADATFASVSLDKIVYNIGPYGFTETTQTNVGRIDLKIPDEVFTIKSTNNGIQRICAQRDFRNEYIFFTVPSDSNNYNYPTKTYLYNYLNQTWAVWDENFTTYGQYWETFDYTWANNPYESGWSTTATWISSASADRYPSVIGGNQQGFVLIKEEKDVGEGVSQYISAFTYVSVTGSDPQKQTVTVTSPNHCLSTNDFVRFESITGISNVSTNNYKVEQILDGNRFTTTHPPTNSEMTDQLSGTYNGNGVYARIVTPSLQTKQFQPFWQLGRKTRIGTSRFLFDRTQEGEVTAQLFVSQDSASPINPAPDFPSPSDSNNALIFSDIVFTSPETGNLNTIGSSGQSQIWHRLSSSVIGDSVQLGITLSEDQMKDRTISISEISLYSLIIDAYPSWTLI